MSKKNSPYFQDFITMVGFSCEAAEYLVASLNDFHPETLTERRQAMHKIENTADGVKHKMMERLSREFVSPIDREDIIQLSSELDDITDKIEDVLIRIYMYNITEMRPAALDFADVILRCCTALRTAMAEFPNFSKSTLLRQAIIDINSMEEKGDAIYIAAMRKLYEEGGDPIQVAAWSELFDRMEDCCDACEHVADLMELITMKNS